MKPSSELILVFLPFLSVYLCTCLFVCVCFCYQCVRLCQSVLFSTCLSVSLLYLPGCLPTSLSLHVSLPIYMHICISIAYIYVYTLSTYLSVWLAIYFNLSTCLLISAGLSALHNTDPLPTWLSTPPHYYSTPMTLLFYSTVPILSQFLGAHSPGLLMMHASRHARLLYPPPTAATDQY